MSHSGRPARHRIRFGVAALSEGWTTPWGISFLPDDRSALVTERPTSQVHLLDRDGTKKRVGEVPYTNSEMTENAAGGLLGVIPSPTWNGTQGGRPGRAYELRRQDPQRLHAPAHRDHPARGQPVRRPHLRLRPPQPLDHTLGIARLREADGLEVIAAPPVRQALLDRLHLGDVLAPYTSVTWRDLPRRGAEPLDRGASGPQITGIPVSAKRPRYAVDAPDDESWVVALRLYDPASGTTALYAPALAAWPDRLQQAAAEADRVIVDGTFWDDEEPRRTGIRARTATGMGHLPIEGPNGTADRLAPLAARCLYTHLNNTNPLVDPAAPHHKRLARPGIEVAHDGMVIEL